MERTFDTGEVLLEETFPLAPDATLKSYMAQVERAVPGMVRELVHRLPGLCPPPGPGGGDVPPCPTEADWTLTPRTPAGRADAILRAFYGYECVYRANGRAFELIGGRVTDRPGRGMSFPVDGGWSRRRG